MYLPVAALLYNSSAICSDTDWQEDDEYIRLAIQLSTEESDRQLAERLSSQLNADLFITEDVPEISEHPQFYNFMHPQELDSKEETEESILLEEYYFGNDMEDKDKNSSSKNKLKEEVLKIEQEVTDNDIFFLTKIFQDLDKKYSSELENLERLFFEDNLLLHYLKSLFVYNENEEALAERTGMAIQELKNLKQSTDKRLIDIKKIAKEQDILEPKDQKAIMIAEFIKKTECSDAFAEKAYKEFIGED